MNTQFIHFTERASSEPGLRFNALMGLSSDPQGLRESFERQPGNKAPSAVKDSCWEPDGVTLQVRFCEGGATYRTTGDSRRYSPLLPLPPAQSND